MKDFFDSIYGGNKHSYHDLEEMYLEPGRAYHGIEHINEMIIHLNAYRMFMDDEQAVFMAAFYHDCVYDSKAQPGVNEAASAQVAIEALTLSNLTAKQLSKVAKYILATAKHEDTDDPDLQLFLDTDLFVLSYAPEKYDAYVRKIRYEYQWASDEQFVEGRKKFIEGMLERKKIYQSPEFQSREKLARENLERELEELCKENSQ